MTLYNDTDPFVCQWLRNLIEAGHLPAGEVIETPIQDIDPADVPETFHTFAGIGGWPLALRMAGWPDDMPVWTGSCPCQPFSTCGSENGFDDDRDLWPAFFNLISRNRPRTIWGEQVVGRNDSWWERAASNLEGAGYGVHAEDWRADVFGCPSMRRRLYWVADLDGESESLCAIYAEARVTQATQGLAREAWADETRAFSDVVAHGLSGVVARANAAIGNTIIPPVAASFIRAFMEAKETDHA